jgi:hypothetical protein
MPCPVAAHVCVPSFPAALPLKREKGETTQRNLTAPPTQLVERRDLFDYVSEPGA